MPSPEELKAIQEKHMTDSEIKMSEKRDEIYKDGKKVGFGRGFLEKKAEGGDSLAEFGLMVGDVGKNFGEMTDKIEGKNENEEKATFEAGSEKGREEGIKAAEKDEQEIKDRAHEIFKKRYESKGRGNGWER